VLAVTSGALRGLWFVLLGGYLVTTVHAELSAVRFTAVIGDIPAGRLMSAPPVCGYAGYTVNAFVATVAAAHPIAATPWLTSTAWSPSRLWPACRHPSDP
jgi:hypothetical protein